MTGNDVSILSTHEAFAVKRMLEEYYERLYRQS